MRFLEAIELLTQASHPLGVDRHKILGLALAFRLMDLPILQTKEASIDGKSFNKFLLLNYFNNICQKPLIA
jgi:hypothetical protein